MNRFDDSVSGGPWVCVVTGGSGAIAQAICKILKENNYICLSPSRTELNVANEEVVKKYFQDNKADILINCAGSIKTSTVVESASKDWIQDVSVNLIGTYLCTLHALKNNCFMIINIGSSAGFKGKATWSAYCAAKAGVASFTQSLADEGIVAYTVSPGRTQSKMRLELFPDEDQNTLLTSDDVAEVVLDVIRGKYPIGANISVKKEDGVKVR